MTPKKIRATKPPPDAEPTANEPKLTVSFWGLKVDGSGVVGVRFAFTIVLVVCGLWVLNTVFSFFHQ
ncbi:hypothetical protein [Caulobacter sp.]|uniref:hypothetical protein n=1 Tax=Caulobacter sp. TaxID=78 RepID=UPI003BAEAEB0